MDSEESAQLTAINRNKRPIVFAQKKRIIDVIQCSGEDMNLVLTNGIPTTSIPSPPQIPFIQRPILSQGLNLILNHSSSLSKNLESIVYHAYLTPIKCIFIYFFQRHQHSYQRLCHHCSRPHCQLPTCHSIFRRPLSSQQ